MDEVVTHILVTDPSLPHMLAGLADGIDLQPPLYFVMMWLWVKLLGSSDLALRIFSTLAVCSALLIIWLLLRRRFGLLPASLGIATTFGFSPLIVNQNSEARFYGLFLVLVALAIRQFDVVVQQRKFSHKRWFANAAIHGSLMLVHVFGGLYSLSVLLSHVLFDMGRKQLRLSNYTSIVLGWLCFIPWIPAHLRQADFVNPHYWIRTPSIQDLMASLQHGLPIAGIIAILVAISLLSNRHHVLKSSPHFSMRSNGEGKGRRAMGIIGVMLVFLIPGATFAISVFYRSIFLDRYMIGSTLGWAILIAYLAEKTAFPVAPSASELRYRWNSGLMILTTLAILIAAVSPLVGVVNYHKDVITSHGTPVENRYYPDLPIVVESPGLFLTDFLRREGRDYYYLLDWDAAINSKNQHETNDFKLMSAIKEHYPELKIVNFDDFLSVHERFLMIEDESRNWSNFRVERNSSFNCTPLLRWLKLVERHDASIKEENLGLSHGG